jgi:hypothetical protein
LKNRVSDGHRMMERKTPIVCHADICTIQEDVFMCSYKNCKLLTLKYHCSLDFLLCQIFDFFFSSLYLSVKCVGDPWNNCRGNFHGTDFSASEYPFENWEHLALEIFFPRRRYHKRLSSIFFFFFPDAYQFSFLWRVHYITIYKKIKFGWLARVIHFSRWAYHRF